MPLSISIDVDWTILDVDENLVPQARESLQQLKDAGHCLQLWSAGGSEYAYNHAVKHKLTDLFDSYAKKPDVAVDDIPESARPVATIRVDNSFRLKQAIELLESKVENKVESALCPSSELKQLVAGLQNRTDEIRTRLGDLLRPDIPLLPVPFFGNIEGASVVTIGLNPAVTEFAKHRSWDQSVDARNLTFRLVNYFRLAGIRYPPAHGWFSEILEFLHLVGCPHRIGYAHADLCPWTSVAPFGLSAGRRQRFWNLIDEEMENGFAQAIACSKQTLKLIVFVQSPNPSSREQERRMRAEHLVRGALPAWGGEIKVKKKEELVGWGWEERSALRDFIGLSSISD